MLNCEEGMYRGPGKYNMILCMNLKKQGPRGGENTLQTEASETWCWRGERMGSHGGRANNGIFKLINERQSNAGKKANSWGA